MARSWLRLALAAYLLILLALTLGWPGAGSGGSIHLVPFQTIGQAWRQGGVALLVNIAGNIAAFVPLGWLAPALRAGESGVGPWPAARSWVLVGAAGGALSLAIECGQWIQGSRVSDVDDLILNVLGAVLAMAAGAHI
jgi:glycopeptide antibiotics resistance protein